MSTTYQVKGKSMAEHVRFADADGTAALGICESLLVALTEAKILSEKETRDLLTDVVSTHQDAVEAAECPGKHHAVIAILRRILAGKNGVRH
jgi:hypothetical protein